MSSLRNFPLGEASSWHAAARRIRSIGRLLPVSKFIIVAASGLALAACENPTHPGVQPTKPSAVAQTRFTCTVTMAQRQLSCTADAPEATSASSTSSLVRANRIVGGQDIYVKLTSSGTAYDAGTEILSSDVTVQNLMQTLVGTSDGTTVEGVSVFFPSDPAVVSGTGVVTVANPDGTGVFTGSNQPYFQYSEILEPYQISAVRPWQFSVPPTVGSFQFTVYVSTTMIDAQVALVDAVWSGIETSLWSLADNWQDGNIPAETSVVAIPRASLLDADASQPTLVADVTVSDIRIGEGSTLTLDGHRLEVARNLDAPGTITGGSVQVTGASARIGGNLPALEISGAARLQRPTATNAAVSITGSLTVEGTPLSIVVP